jgi:hypothetical protein
MSQIRTRLPVLGLLARSAVIPAVVLVATNMVMVMFIPVLHMVVVGVAGLLAASGLPLLRRPRRAKLLLRIQFLVVAALAVAGAAALVYARMIPVVPNPSTMTAELIFAVGAIPLVLLAWRAGRTYLLTRRISDLVVVEGIVWLTAAQFGLLNFTMMHGAWWAAHALEVAGIGMVAIPVALDLRHAVASRPLVGDLRAADLVEHEEAFLGGRFRALLVRLGEKDPSTEGHTRRVATLAVVVGEHLGLPEGRLRQLAVGGQLHDVGKLSVPNEILNKPGRLTDDEFDEIRRHPGAGRELLIDLEVRVLTVAHVYDALTADRVYREAWPAERALALLDDETGRAFDPECVGALRAIVSSEQPALSPARVRREPEPAPLRGRPSPVFGEAAA